MIAALIDNGSLEPAAHLNLRVVAAALSARTATVVHAVSWKHSDRIAPAALNDTPASTIAPFVRAMMALGQREFVFVPFFISQQGAIGSALRRDLEGLRTERPDFEFSFSDGLAARAAIPAIVSARVREVMVSRRLVAPPVIVVDHGGPSSASATLRDELANEIRRQLGTAIAFLAAASMEGSHPPLLADQLCAAEFAQSDVVVAPLFLSPGRHAGPEGDVAQICASAPARCHLSGLVGTHPFAVDALAAALQATLSTRHASTFA